MTVSQIMTQRAGKVKERSGLDDTTQKNMTLKKKYLCEFFQREKVVRNVFKRPTIFSFVRFIKSKLDGNDNILRADNLFKFGY